MIVELFLDLLFQLVSALMSPLNLFNVPIGSFAGLIELFSYASIFVPLDTFSVCLGIWFAFQFTRFTISVVNWIIGKIPTIN